MDEPRLEVGGVMETLAMGDCSRAKSEAQWAIRPADSAQVQFADVASSTCRGSARRSDGALTNSACNTTYPSQHFQLLASPLPGKFSLKMRIT